MNKQSLPVHSHRVLYGLSRIGYTPTSAICDIVDNAVTAGAKNIFIQIIKVEEGLSDNRANNIKEYLIIDDGKGMDNEGIINALSLGSDGSTYDANSLSKFGLGLKSASFAQGNRLDVISSTGAEDFHKHTVDLEEIAHDYFSIVEDLSEDDRDLVNLHLPEGHGTIVRISKIHKSNHPSLSTTKNELEAKLGITYYYFMSEGCMKIILNNEEIEPYDVLFTDEANNNGDLDENVWDGKTVKWILHPERFTIDGESGASCVIEATQLPYPPIFQLDGSDKQAETRAAYNIAAGNYGFYVYRNKRLISWAERFNGIIPLDQDLYAFRGRVLINGDADNPFNIDVKKSNISLSGEAETTIDDVADKLKRKSRFAWKRARRELDRLTKDDPNEISNDYAKALGNLDNLPGDMPTPEEEMEQQNREKDVAEESKRNAVAQTKKRLKQETGHDVEQPPEEEVEKTIRGDNRDSGRIFKVESLEDNLLWEPYFDASKKHCVRINKNHRFARLIYEDYLDNADMQIIFDLLMLHFVEADYYVRTKMKDYERSIIESIIWEYRRVISEMLAALCRNKNISLPPRSSVDQ